MSELSIVEVTSIVRTAAGQTIEAFELNDNAVLQNVTYTITSTQSAAFGASTRAIRVAVASATRILIGADPTALASASVLLVANESMWIGVRPGDKLAAIDAI